MVLTPRGFNLWFRLPVIQSVVLTPRCVNLWFSLPVILDITIWGILKNIDGADNVQQQRNKQKEL